MLVGIVEQQGNPSILFTWQTVLIGDSTDLEQPIFPIITERKCSMCSIHKCHRPLNSFKHSVIRFHQPQFQDISKNPVTKFQRRVKLLQFTCIIGNGKVWTVFGEPKWHFIGRTTLPYLANVRIKMLKMYSLRWAIEQKSNTVQSQWRLA